MFQTVSEASDCERLFFNHPEKRFLAKLTSTGMDWLRDEKIGIVTSVGCNHVDALSLYY